MEEWLDEIQRAKELGLTTKEIREWLNDLIKEKNKLKRDPSKSTLRFIETRP